MASVDITDGFVSALVLGGKAVSLDIAKTILAASQEEVPVDTGELKLSGEIIETDKGYLVKYSALTDSGYDYAIRQHEDTSLYHPNGGKAGYLRDPALRIVSQYVHVGNVLDHFEEAMKRVRGV